MNIGLRPISKEIFENNVNIRFNNILDGFNNYKYKHLECNYDVNLKFNEMNFIKFIEESYKLNKNSCYIDFYIKNLNQYEYNKLLEGLDGEDKNILNSIWEYILKNSSYVTEYFEVNDIYILKLLVKMCTRELFFITFYFTEIPLTIWGNYNLSFPIFFEDDSILDTYIETAKKLKLYIR